MDEGLTSPRDLPWWSWRVGLMESWNSPETEFGFTDIVVDWSFGPGELRYDMICLWTEMVTGSCRICAWASDLVIRAMLSPRDDVLDLSRRHAKL